MNNSLMNEEFYWNLMSRYLADDLSLEETEALLQWLNEDSSKAEVLKELQETWDMSKMYPEKFFVDTNAALLKVRRSLLAPKPSGVKVRRSLFLKWFCILGSVFIVAGLLSLTINYFSTKDIIEIETLASQRKEVVLPDGSKVWLNESSSLSYLPDLDGQDLRLVKLKGEGYFEVNKNSKKKFLIEAGEAKIQSIESSLNVLQDRKGNVKVAVLAGSVSLKARDKPEQRLTLFQGEEGINYKEGYMDKSAYKNLNFLYWKTGQLNFDSTSLSSVIHTLEQVYNVKFYVRDSGLLSRKFTGSFYRSPLEKVIEELESLLNLRVQKAGSIYIIQK